MRFAIAARLLAMMRRLVLALALLAGLSAPAEAEVKIVLLGTGNPNPTPDRAGPSLAVIAGGKAYLFDFGTGVVRAAQKAFEAGEETLEPKRLDIAFLTHLHSDHTLGLADLVITPWVLERAEPLRVYGPSGTSALVEGTLAAYWDDIRLRVKGRQPSNETGWRAVAREIAAGPVYEDGNIAVEAFLVCHGDIAPAFGFRVKAAGKIIVISGDTASCPQALEHFKGADALVHEVYSTAGFATLPPAWQAYHASHHTSSAELASLAAEVRPKLLILTHHLQWGGLPLEIILDEVKSGYGGAVVFGRDGDVFTLGNAP
ncbi:MAG TPA: MBL fold metallo-hydrolase [Sphingomonadales bacterium]|nr:MBL fold metallo-hydrolase [Sphingomonadales bacterium]